MNPLGHTVIIKYNILFVNTYLVILSDWELQTCLHVCTRRT